MNKNLIKDVYNNKCPYLDFSVFVVPLNTFSLRCDYDYFLLSWLEESKGFWRNSKNLERTGIDFSLLDQIIIECK